MNHEVFPSKNAEVERECYEILDEQEWDDTLFACGYENNEEGKQKFFERLVLNMTGIPPHKYESWPPSRLPGIYSERVDTTMQHVKDMQEDWDYDCKDQIDFDELEEGLIDAIYRGVAGEIPGPVKAPPEVKYAGMEDPPSAAWEPESLPDYDEIREL